MYLYFSTNGPDFLVNFKGILSDSSSGFLKVKIFVRTLAHFSLIFSLVLVLEHIQRTVC